METEKVRAVVGTDTGMGHYDDFYEAEAELERRRREKADESPLEGVVESVAFTDAGSAIVSICVPFYSEARKYRLLDLLSGVRTQTLKEHNRRRKDSDG